MESDLDIDGIITRCFQSLLPKRIIGVVGALGSGKSECLINLARAFKEAGEATTLADIDIINPYFSVREITEILQAEGFTVINPPGDTRWGDIPALSPAVGRAIAGEARLFLDVGGDERGAMALTQFAPEICAAGYALLMVVNASRPAASSLDALCSLSDRLAGVAELPLTALISNTHFMKETQREDVLRGIDLCKEASERLRIPLLCAAVDKELWYQSFDGAEELEGVPLWPLRRTILLPWERGVVNG